MSAQLCVHPALSTLALWPISHDDGRTSVALPPGGEPLKLGRCTREAPNPWGVHDPRISREHVCLASTPGPAVTAVALGRHPVAVVREGGERLLLSRGELAELRRGDELHLVDEASTPASGASQAWAGQPCAYRIGVSDSALHLHPTDGRQPVRLTLDSGSDVKLEPLKLGRCTREAPNPWGVHDPRVSREHVGLTLAPGLVFTVSALGRHPVAVVREGGERLLLSRGELAELRRGDELHLVDEASTPASGASQAWAGQPCAYRVELRGSSPAPSGRAAPAGRPPLVALDAASASLQPARTAAPTPLDAKRARPINMAIDHAKRPRVAAGSHSAAAADGESQPRMCPAAVALVEGGAKGAPLIRVPGEALVGRRLSVYCPNDAEWCQASIVAHDSQSGQHQIRLSKGQFEWRVLAQDLAGGVCKLLRLARRSHSLPTRRLPTRRSYRHSVL